MKRHWIFRLSTVWCVSGVYSRQWRLFTPSPRLKVAMWRAARPSLSDTALVVMARRVEGMGTSFFVDRIRLTSHLGRPERI